MALALASTFILGSESHRTHDNILLSHDSGSPATLSPAAAVTDILYIYIYIILCLTLCQQLLEPG
jgi:hypothetical protein